MSEETERFSLKDFLFNKEKVKKISAEINAVYPDFDKKSFQKKVLEKFPVLELSERIGWIRQMLKEHLPDDYRKAVTILLTSLPPEADSTKSDNDFGDFIYAPYGDFVATYGCTKKDLSFSLKALKEFTTRFSAEGPIRAFLNAFPEKTLKEIMKWTTDSHYHVRRLASEGTRPLLPWAKKISVPYKRMTPILDALYTDKTRFVTRSVANHVNDVSKIDQKMALQLLKKWKKSKKQEEKEMDYIISHGLRTLIKEGDKEALTMLGYHAEDIEVKRFKILTPNVQIGKSLEFSFDIESTSKEEQKLMIDYVLYFQKANGTRAPKTFKIAKKNIKGKETLHITKKHPLRVMTTRKLYPGTHTIALQINGRRFGSKHFKLQKKNAA